MRRSLLSRFLWRSLVSSGLIAFVTLLGPFARLSLADSPDVWKEIVDRFAKEHVEKANGIPGLVIGISTPDGRHLFYCYGVTKAAGPAPTKQTLFEIGSVTKVFTALALAQMVEAGEVKLDDPVRLLLPRDVTVPQRGKQEITLRELATHTSGLPRISPDQFGRGIVEGLLGAFITGQDPLADPYAKIDARQLQIGLAAIKLKPNAKPQSDYSNLGMGLLGFALAHKAGTSYEQLITKRITGPLHMPDTVQTASAEQEKRKAVGHRQKGEPVPCWTFDALAGCGALSSTADDLLRLADAESGRVPTPLAAAMQRTQEKQVSLSKELGIGLALHFLDFPDGHRIWIHDGGTNGYSSFFAFSRSPQAAVVILANSGPLSEARKIDAFAVELSGRVIGAEEPIPSKKPDQSKKK